MTSYRHNSAPPGSFYIHQDVEQGALYILYLDQSVTSRLETSVYRDFFSFFESIDKFGLERSLSIGPEKFWSQKKVSVWVSNIFGLKKNKTK